VLSGLVIGGSGAALRPSRAGMGSAQTKTSAPTYRPKAVPATVHMGLGQARYKTLLALSAPPPDCQVARNASSLPPVPASRRLRHLHHDDDRAPLRSSPGKVAPASKLHASAVSPIRSNPLARCGTYGVPGMDLRCAQAPFSRRASAAVPARCPTARGTVTATVRIRACSRAPLRKPGLAVDITTRIERRQVLGGLISGYRRAA
jgi:hypothetical protein